MALSGRPPKIWLGTLRLCPLVRASGILSCVGAVVHFFFFSKTCQPDRCTAAWSNRRESLWCPLRNCVDSALCDGVSLPTASSAPPLSPAASNLLKVELGPPTLDVPAFLVAGVLLPSSVQRRHRIPGDSTFVLVGTHKLDSHVVQKWP